VPEGRRAAVAGEGGGGLDSGGVELKLLLLEAFLYVPIINTRFCLCSVDLIYY